MGGHHQPENGADSHTPGCGLFASPSRSFAAGRCTCQTAETATASSDRFHSAGVAPDGVAQQTVAGSSSGSRRGATVTTYERGYAAGRRAAEREGQILIAALVEQAGGEIRLTHKYIVSTTGDLTRYDDPDTMDIVYRAGPRR